MRCHAVLFVSVSALHLQVVLVASVSLLLVPEFQRSADLATEVADQWTIQFQSSSTRKRVRVTLRVIYGQNLTVNRPLLLYR